MVHLCEVMLSLYQNIYEPKSQLDPKNEEDSFDFRLQEEFLKPLSKLKGGLKLLSKGEAKTLRKDTLYDWGFKTECHRAIPTEFHINREATSVSLVIPDPKESLTNISDLIYPLIRGSEFGPIVSFWTNKEYIMIPSELEWVFSGGKFNFLFSKFGQITGGVEVSFAAAEWQTFRDLLDETHQAFGGNYIRDERLRFLFAFRHIREGVHVHPLRGTPLTKAQNLEASYAHSRARKYTALANGIMSDVFQQLLKDFKTGLTPELLNELDQNTNAWLEVFVAHVEQIQKISTAQDPISDFINLYILTPETTSQFHNSMNEVALGELIGDHLRGTIGKLGFYFTDIGTLGFSNSAATECGKKFPFHKNFYEIDYFELSCDGPGDMTRFWRHTPSMTLWNLDKTLSGGESPISAKELYEAIDDDEVLLYDFDEIENTTNLLFEEAEALKEFFIPPNAYVEVRFGPFVGCQLTELNNDVLIKWVTEDNRFFQMSMWPSSTNFNFFMFGENEVGAWSRDKGELHRKNESNKLIAIKQKLCLLAASIIRDFWVVDDRDEVFYVRHVDTRNKKITGKARTQNSTHKPSVIYIPRRRYSKKINLNAYEKELSLSERAKHVVRQHFRKANPSQAQIQLSKILKVQIPDGHTLVKTHYRGGEEKQRIYRSISALKLASNSIADEIVSPNDMPTWFDFENEVGRIQKLMGYEVLFKAANYSGDGGIDLRVRKKTSKKIEEVLIQCKCWKATVGPDVVREMMGTLVENQNDEIDLRGAIYTTSRFSKEATALAVKNNIQLVDGDTWAKLSNQMTYN